MAIHDRNTFKQGPAKLPVEAEVAQQADKAAVAPAVANNVNTVFTSPLETLTSVASPGIASAITVRCSTPAIVIYESAATAAWSVNFTASDTVALSTLLTPGRATTCVIEVTMGATVYNPTAFYVDSVAVTPRWAGSATVVPAGTANARNEYRFTIRKSASGVISINAALAVY